MIGVCQQPLGRAKGLVGHHTPTVAALHVLGKGNRIALDHNVHVQCLHPCAGRIEQQIAHEAAHNINRKVQIISCLAQQL